MSTRDREIARARAALRLPRLHDKSKADWMRLVRFCVVGASGYVVNLIVFAILVHGTGMHYLAAAIVSFVVAVTNNFLLNKYWTFQRHEERAHTQGLRYLVVSLIALGLNLVVLEALIAVGLADVPAQAIAIIIVTPVNFLLNHRWTFVDRDGDVPSAPAPGEVPERDEVAR